jgi:hypothetical protein
MAKIFDKDRSTQLVAHLNSLKIAYDELVASAEKYNVILEDIRDFRESVVDTMRDYIDKKSEKWQEGDRGQQWANAMDLWETAPIDDIDTDDLFSPDDLESLPSDMS